MYRPMVNSDRFTLGEPAVTELLVIDIYVQERTDKMHHS